MDPKVKEKVLELSNAHSDEKQDVHEEIEFLMGGEINDSLDKLVYDMYDAFLSREVNGIYGECPDLLEKLLVKELKLKVRQEAIVKTATLHGKMDHYEVWSCHSQHFTFFLYKGDGYGCWALYEE